MCSRLSRATMVRILVTPAFLNSCDIAPNSASPTPCCRAFGSTESANTQPHGGEPSFQLLTHGVWVQSYQYELIKGHKLGGVICFDRLHKTVDHSGFVRDDRFEELWLRLRPHAGQGV